VGVEVVGCVGECVDWVDLYGVVVEVVFEGLFGVDVDLLQCVVLDELDEWVVCDLFVELCVACV